MSEWKLRDYYKAQARALRSWRWWVRSLGVTGAFTGFVVGSSGFDRLIQWHTLVVWVSVWIVLWPIAPLWSYAHDMSYNKIEQRVQNEESESE